MPSKAHLLLLRSVAVIIDGLLLELPFVVVDALTSATSGTVTKAGLYLTYRAGSQWFGGATVGKRICSLTVTPRGARLLLRELPGALIILAIALPSSLSVASGALIAAWVLADLAFAVFDSSRSLHDWTAGTSVSEAKHR